MPRSSTTVGRPGANRIDPGGRSRRIGTATTSSPATRATAKGVEPLAGQLHGAETDREQHASGRAQPPRGVTPRAAADSSYDGQQHRRPDRGERRDPRNTQRQPTVAVIAPAKTGPINDGSTHAPAITANTRGRLSSGKTRATST